MSEWNLARDGFCLLPAMFPRDTMESCKVCCDEAFGAERDEVVARSSRGHVYAARNLIGVVPTVETLWQQPAILKFLNSELGETFGLVRALFFDKPPARTWNLPWHKDTAIAVRQHVDDCAPLSRPTTKAGTPHYIAHDELLKTMLTLRVHLDDVSSENGPLQVIPRSHLSSTSEGLGPATAVEIHARSGDVLAMRPLLSHASGSSLPGTTRHRRILHLEFAASPQLPGSAQWHDYIRPQLYSDASGSVVQGS